MSSPKGVHMSMDNASRCEDGLSQPQQVNLIMTILSEPSFPGENDPAGQEDEMYARLMEIADQNGVTVEQAQDIYTLYIANFGHGVLRAA